MSTVTAFDVVNKRKFELTEENNILFLEERRIKEEYEASMVRISKRRQEIELEMHIFDSFDDCGIVIITTTTTTTTTVSKGRKSKADKMLLEDMLIKLVDSYGGIVSKENLVNGLAKFGQVWSTNRTAYKYITQHCPILEEVAEGCFQLRKGYQRTY